MKKILKIVACFIVGYILFALISSTLSCAFPKEVEKEDVIKVEIKMNKENSSFGADRATVIESSFDGLAARLAMIDATQTSLDIVTHNIIRSPAIDTLMSKILQAADRGVQVRILIDGKTPFLQGGKTIKLLQSLATNPNITCKGYNPINFFTPWNWHFMLHDKFIVADHQYLLIGGRNFHYRHFDTSDNKKSITQDRDVLIWKEKEEGESGVTQSSTYFNSLWESSVVKEIKKKEGRVKEEVFLQLDQRQKLFMKTDSRYFEKTFGDYLAQTHPTYQVTLLTGEIKNSLKKPFIGEALKELALQGKEEVVIQSPYTTMGNHRLEGLKEIVEKVPVKLMTNSKGSSPNILAFSNYLGHRKTFINTGIAIYEYQNTNSIHGKSMVVDKDISVIGSYNLDDRSRYINTETMVVIQSPQVTEELLAAMENIESQSLQVGKDNEYTENVLVKEEKPSLGKKILLWLFFWMMRPFQFLL